MDDVCMKTLATGEFLVTLGLELNQKDVQNNHAALKIA